MTIQSSELVQTLGAALGLPRQHVEDTARHLREAGMLPDDSGAEATVEGAVALLLGLMAAPDPKDAPACAQLYAQLPLVTIDRAELTARGSFKCTRLAEDLPFVRQAPWGKLERSGCMVIRA